MTDAPRPRSLTRFLPIVVIAGALALALIFRVHEHLAWDALYARTQRLDALVTANFLAAFVLFILIYAAVVTISLPGGGLLKIAGGFLLGAWIGGAAAWAGAMIGAIVVFLAARTAFGDVLRGRAGGWVERLRTGFAEGAFSYLLVLRLTPVAPFIVVNIVPALVGVSLRTYLLATAIGIVPATFIYTSVGAGLKAGLATGAAADQEEALRAVMSSPATYVPMLALVALAFVPMVVKALRRK